MYSGNSKSLGTGWFGVKAAKRGRGKKMFFSRLFILEENSSGWRAVL